MDTTTTTTAGTDNGHAHCRYCGQDMGASWIMLERLDWFAHFGRCPGYEAAKRKAAEKPSRVLGDCLRCSGTGKLPKFSHVNGGRCFKCDGTGNAGPHQRIDRE